MNVLKRREGDLFTAIRKSARKTIVVPHVVNDKGAWGAGFVVPLGKKFPYVKESYLKWANSETCDSFALGNIQEVHQLSGASDVIFVNMLAQTLVRSEIDFSRGERPLFYNHLVSCMEKVAELALDHDAAIYCPKFGSGLAGGRWDFIQELIKDCWCRTGIDTTYFVFV